MYILGLLKFTPLEFETEFVLKFGRVWRAVKIYSVGVFLVSKTGIFKILGVFKVNKYRGFLGILH